MLQFLAVLIQAMEMSGLEVAVFFNGCFEPLRRADWVQHQLQVRAKINNVSLLHNYIFSSIKQQFKFSKISFLKGLETYNNKRYTATKNLVDSSCMFKD